MDNEAQWVYLIDNYSTVARFLKRRTFGAVSRNASPGKGDGRGRVRRTQLEENCIKAEAAHAGDLSCPAVVCRCVDVYMCTALVSA